MAGNLFGMPAKSIIRMRKLLNLFKIKLPRSLVFCMVALSLVLTTYVEGSALYKIDHPTPKKTSCIACHTDKKTLAAIAAKSNDPLYLVHSGDLTLEQLKKLEGGKAQSATHWKSY